MRHPRNFSILLFDPCKQRYFAPFPEAIHIAKSDFTQSGQLCFEVEQLVRGVFLGRGHAHVAEKLQVEPLGGRGDVLEITKHAARAQPANGATKRINRGRGEAGILWQPRFFDRALRTVREYNEKVEYMNPVRAGLARRAEEWPWSSVHDYTGSVERPVATPSGLEIDRVLLPADEHTRI